MTTSPHLPAGQLGNAHVGALLGLAVPALGIAIYAGLILIYWLPVNRQLGLGRFRHS